MKLRALPSQVFHSSLILIMHSSLEILTDRLIHSLPGLFKPVPCICVHVRTALFCCESGVEVAVYDCSGSAVSRNNITWKSFPSVVQLLAHSFLKVV